MTQPTKNHLLKKWLLVAFLLFHAPLVQAQDDPSPPAAESEAEEDDDSWLYEDDDELAGDEDDAWLYEDDEAVADGDDDEGEASVDDGALTDEEGEGVEETAEEPGDASDEAIADADDDGVEQDGDDTPEETATRERDPGEEDPTIEQVVVLGIQRALDNALAEKRRTANLIEVISAESIGKLPDENVAEVLENIPGVQITREGGIGEEVSVRGSDENRVEINGRGTLSDGDARGGMRFSDLPAALVRSLTVTKVPTADMVEGSIGGTINIRTWRGLNLEEPLLVGNFRSEYGDNADEFNFNYSGTAGNRFETPFGDIGAILTVSHIEKTIRQDQLRVSPAVRTRRGNPSNTGLFPDFDGNPNDVDPYYYPGFSDTQYGFEDRQNTTLNGTLAWQVAEPLKLYLEGTYSHVDNLERSQSAFGGYGPFNPRLQRSDRELDSLSDLDMDGLPDATFDFVEVAGVQVPVLTSGTLGAGFADCALIGPMTDFCETIDGATPAGAPNDGLRIRTNSRANSRRTDSFVAAFGGEWEPADNWGVDLEASASRSDSTQHSLVTVFQYNEPGPNFNDASGLIRVPFIFDSRGETLQYGPIRGTPRAANLWDPDYYSLFVARDNTTRFDNALYAQRMDVERLVDEIPILTRVAFGARFSQRSTKRERTGISTDAFPGSNPANDLTGLDRFLVGTPGDFFQFNQGGVYFDNFLTPDANNADILRRFLIDNAGLGANNAFAPPQGFLVDEKTYSGYLRLDFATDLLPWDVRGNVGVRFVHTDQLADGSQLNDDGSTFSPIVVNQKYDNWLPSASLVVSPLEEVQLRFGYAKILRRPNFAQLAPTFIFPLNAQTAVTVGDPNLRPTQAHQFDAAIEWYPRRGTVLSVGYFFKKFDQTIGTILLGRNICNPIVAGNTSGFGACDPVMGVVPPGVKVDEIRWRNLPGGTIQGAEVAIQHNMNYLPQPFRGLGFIANYAFQRGERGAFFRTPQFLRNDGAEDKLFPLNFRLLSEHSYNVTAYYEKPRYGFSARVRYTWRDDFLISESIDVANGAPLYRKARGQLNASASIQLPEPLERFALILAGVNLTKEQGVETAAVADGPTARVRDADRRLTVGLRARW